MMSESTKPGEWSETARFGVLFGALAAMILLMPLAAQQHGPAVILRALLTLVLLSGVYASSRNRAVLMVSILLAGSASITGWIADLRDSEMTAAVSWVLAVVNITFVGGVVATAVLRREQVTGDAIFAILSVFLLIGIAFAIVFALVEYFHPGSFLLRGEIIPGADTLTGSAYSFSVLLYLSFVTLATVGYGDIHPIEPLAQILCATEGIVGQVFLAVVVARVIGMSLAARDPGTEG